MYDLDVRSGYIKKSTIHIQLLPKNIESETAFVLLHIVNYSQMVQSIHKQLA